MRRKHVLIYTICGLITWTVTSCKKDNTQPSGINNNLMIFSLNAEKTVTVLAAVPGNHQSLAALAGSDVNNNFSLSSAIANVSGFKVEAKKQNKEIEISATGLFKLDLAAVASTAASAKIDTGTYSEIELRTLFVKSSTAVPLTLHGNLQVATSTSVPVEIDYNEDATIKTEAKNVTVDGTKDVKALMSINLSKLWTGITMSELSSATRASNTIVINATTNADIYNKIKTNLTSGILMKGFEFHDKSERERD